MLLIHLPLKSRGGGGGREKAPKALHKATYQSSERVQTNVYDYDRSTLEFRNNLNRELLDNFLINLQRYGIDVGELIHRKELANILHQICNKICAHENRWLILYRYLEQICNGIATHGMINAGVG